MKRRVSLLLFILTLVFNVYAQKGEITGRILDNQDESAIPFATISIERVSNRESNSKSMGAYSNTDGSFKIEKISRGDYLIRVSFLGYKSLELNRAIDGESISLGDLTLVSENQILDEVVISAEKRTVQQKIDRQVFNSSDFETARGGSGIDLMNKLPSVSVSPDGEVSVRGTNDFIVYLNGKPTQIEPSILLGQLSSSDISNIEVITVPSAKFDAQGKGGIINISTKRSVMEGLSLSINGNIGGSPWHNSTDRYSDYKMSDNRYGVGVNGVYSKGTVSLYGSFSYNSKNVNGARIGDARILQSDGSYYHMVASGERPEWYEFMSGRLGVDWKINRRSDISLSYFYGNRYEGRSAFYIYNNFYADIDGGDISSIDREDDWIYNPNTDNRRGVFNSLNFDYNFDISDNTKLNFSTIYENSSLTRELNNQNFDYNPESDSVGAEEQHFIQADDTPLDSYTFALGLSREFDNGDIFEVGVQPRILRIDGVFTYDTLNVADDSWGAYESLENSIDVNRDLYAAYLNYTGSVKSLDYIVGLRMEYTDQLMNISNPDYFTIFERESKSEFKESKVDWFPTLHLNYALNETNKISLAANRRISRPPIKNMAPFLYRRHYEVYAVGDPELEAEYSTSVELGYNRLIGDQSFNLVGFYRGTNNAVFRVNTVYEEENVLIRSYTNSGTTTAWGAELNANGKIGESIKLFLGGSIYSYRVKGDVFGYQEDNSSINYSLKGNVVAQLFKGVSWTTDFDLKSGTVTAQGQNDMFYMMNSAFNYKPSGLKQWDFSLSVLDILGSNSQGLDTRVYDADDSQIFYQETTYNRTGQIAMLSASYRFNNFGKREKSKKIKTAGDQEF